MTSQIQQYVDHGWHLCLVQPGSKGPTSAGWNRIENAIKSADDVSEGWGIGLLHAYSSTAALDVDDLDEATLWLAERGVDLQQLLNASDAVQIDSGNTGHAKLLYTLPFPLSSKKISIGNKTILEFRCASANGKTTQDVLPPSRHPSGTTYRWAGKGNWQQLPVVPEKLLAIWTELLEADTRKNIPAGEGVPPASIEELKKAVFHIDPNCPRAVWIQVGMGLAEQSQELFDLWDEWSQGSETKYPGEREMLIQWKSFREKENGITVATVFHHAIAAGYRRPLPEMKFESVIQPNGIGEVVKSISMTSHIPECDMTLWPTVLSRRAVEVGAEVGCDPVVPLIAGLAAISAAADKRIRLSLNPTWHVPPNIWLMTIGEPADKKTPGSKPMFAPLRKLEAEDHNRFQAEMLKWKGIEARHAGDMKAFREWQQSPDSHLPNAIPPAVTPLPPMPADLRLLISDATSQKVVTMAELRPRGFMLYLDEMNRWLTKLSDARNSDDRGSWIQGYETGPYTMDRVGAGTIKVENLALSFYGNCQPEVFRRTVDGASSDGIIQRFLPVVLNPKHNAMWQKAVPEFMSAANDYEQLVRRTFALPTFDYELSEEGTLVFRKFCEGALYTRETERLFNRSAVFQTSLGKMEGSCARLILLFHLCENPYSYAVDAETVRRATTVFEKFFVPSMRFTYLEVAEQEEKLADDLLRLVVQWASVRETASLAEIRKGLRDNGRSKYGPSVLDQMIRVYMDDFSTLGYVAILQDHPRFPVWSINPAVADLFKRERQEIIRRKKERLDAFKQELADAGKPMSIPKFVVGE